MSSTPTHITPPQAHELARLGAFEGRELRVGDWVEVKYADMHGVSDSYIDLIYSQDEYGNVYAGTPSIGKWIAVTDCLLLASETDLMDEIERLTGSRNISFYGCLGLQDIIVEYYNPEQNICHRYVANTRLDALFNAVCAVCKMKREAS